MASATAAGKAAARAAIRTTLNKNLSIQATNPPHLRYLSAWFCPYAHRATIALEHHAGRVDYEWVEVRRRRSD